jgi:hypothetical protein
MPWSSVTLAAALGPVAASVNALSAGLSKEMLKLVALKAVLDMALGTISAQMQAMEALISALEASGFYVIRLSPARGNWLSRLEMAANAPLNSGFSTGVCSIFIAPEFDVLLDTYAQMKASLDIVKEIARPPDRINNTAKIQPPKPNPPSITTDIWLSATLRDLMPGLGGTMDSVANAITGIMADISYASKTAGLALSANHSALASANAFMGNLAAAGGYMIMLPPASGGIFTRLQSEANRPPDNPFLSTCGFCACMTGVDPSAMYSRYADLQALFTPELEIGINVPDPDGFIYPGTEVGNRVGDAIVSLTISPENSSVMLDGTIQFYAYVSGSTNNRVIWSVVGSGTIDADGFYTATPNLSASEFVTIKATTYANLLVSYSTQLALIKPTEEEVFIQVYPSIIKVNIGEQYQFTAVVEGTGNKKVLWEVAGSGYVGTISDTGLYTAPRVAKIVTVKITSDKDPTKISYAQVEVVVMIVPNDLPLTQYASPIAQDETVRMSELEGPRDTNIISVVNPYVVIPAVEFTLSPISAFVEVGRTLQLQAPVGTTWSVSGSLGGTISGSGLYTCPGTVIMPIAGVPRTDIITATYRGETLTAVINQGKEAADAPIPRP